MGRLKSFSKVNSYITCPYQHYLRYTEKWYPKQKSRALSVGSAIHECCEYYRKNKIDEFNFDQTNEIDLRKWFELYKKYSKIQEEYDFVFIEKTFKCKGFIGILDGLVKNKKTGKLWIYEMKTFSKMPNEFDRMFRPQPYVYYQQLKNKGIQVEGVVWEYVRSELPKEPALLKNGKLSSVMTQNIIPDTIIEACNRYGLNVADYSDLLERSKINVSNYFDVKERYIVPEVAEKMFNEFNSVRVNGKNKKKHINSLTCKSCSYKDVCLAELTNVDAEYILEENFERRKK